MAPKFELINRYAHKRSGINIGNPALILHRAYWKPKGENNDREWHRNIDHYIELTRMQTRRFIGSHGGSLVVNDDRGPAPPAVDMHSEANNYSISLSGSTINIVISDVKIAILFEKFDEFWSIKTVVDFSYFTPHDITPTYLVRLNNNLTTIEECIRDRYNTALAHAGEGDHPLHSDADRKAVQAEIGRISHSVSAISSHLLDDLFPPGLVGIGPTACNLSADLFVDFVGFSLGIDLDRGSSRPAGILRRGKSGDVVSNIRADGVFDRRSDSKVLRLIDAAWPIATDLNPYVAHGEARIGDEFVLPRTTREFTISRINRSRSLYITSLGAMREDLDHGVYFPLSYLLICPHRASWQIGRVVDRIHTLGLFRLASFVEYENIEEANNGMRVLIDQINSGGDVEQIARKFTRISTSVENGLHYRIEWAKYYYSLFRKTMDMLDFERVEGYQTYSEFVTRKLNERFETIDSVSRRFDYLSRLIRTGMSQITNSSIRELLSFAEKVSVIPIAYYSYHVLDFVDRLGIIEFVNRPVARLVGVWLPWPAFKVIWIVCAIHYAAFTLIYKPMRKTDRGDASRG